MSTAPGAAGFASPAGSPRPVWLDTDPGFDDWLTLLMLAAHPGLRLLGVSVVAGNAPLQVTLANALAIRRLHGLQLPIHRGSDRPLAAALETAQHILGAQGMRSTGRPLPPADAQPDGDDAVAALLAALRGSPEPVTLVAIGPLTNIARALQAEPTAAAGIGELLLMGGSTDRGNHTAAAEFNIHADPEAADIVFNAGLRLRMFGLNLCRQVLVTQSEVAQLRQLPGLAAQCLADHFDAYQRIRSADGSVPMPLYDPVVAAWLWQPALFGFQAARVDIELQGRFTRGMTVCDWRPAALPRANAEVAMEADGPAVVELSMRVLRQALQA
jgi:purine nucleosidase